MFKENKSRSLEIDSTRLIASHRIDPDTIRRLIVLVPSGKLDGKALAKRIWRLAHPTGLKVLYVALAGRENEVAYYRRRLADLAAMTNYEPVTAGRKTIVGGSWVRAVGEIRQPGDLVICLEGHELPDGLTGRKRLGDVLSASLNVPVYVLGGILEGSSLSRYKEAKEILGWLLFLLVMAVFTGLQIWFEHQFARPLAMILVSLSVVIELGVVLKIYRATN